MSKNKKKNKTPRRKMMKRQSRLQSAKHWVLTYTGKNIIKGYRNWFGVDLPCAIQELKTLGIKLDDQYVCQILQDRERTIAMRHRQCETKKQQELENLLFDSDEHFYFIAGYTSGGFPYGITWEDAIEQG